jgi:excisionase family DNA binding protein
VPEALKYLDAKGHPVSNDGIIQLLRKGKIPASKVGIRWRVKKEDIDRHWKVTT